MKLQKSFGSSRLSFVELDDVEAAYSSPIFFIELEGSRQEMGAAYANLVGQEAIDAYEYVLHKAGVGLIAKKALESFLDNQWSQWLSKSVPQQYIEEFQGMLQESKKLGLKPTIDKVVQRVTVLANLPSDLPEDMIPVLEDELAQSSDGALLDVIEIVRELFARPGGKQCSMYATWGTRTENNQLFSARNLEYASNTGVNQWKSVTVWKPVDGSHSHAAFGFVPLYGVLAGTNSQGITVHEANLEENIETFRGFPWIIRLRWIMENAKNIAQGEALWRNSNNTVGYNHAICSSVDAAPFSHPALALETRAWYTAYFQDNDPRETTVHHYDAEKNKTYVQYGHSLKEALWRTNHGYDPKIVDNYQWYGYGAWRWSMQRYNFSLGSFEYYERTNQKIGPLQAINMTSILGDKGPTAYTCDPAVYQAKGSNILATTHQPAINVTFASWEDGADDTWKPAACATFVRFDMTRYWIA
eukprot:CAMPEP_0201546194 /NCGR_PEP_ID=MMETSP0173_2-20130828/2558_1 /ASSEMBLY_ACC=CAM_ASM_000268 /TAXON_ID=218659 /ORGANISM="Vexillifera sp., Strain DIVA3 564/2" /LENGTH=471 /DNA_ID=CAMNT_0047954801 /DNA_START=123 /DNA_END=1538 /DNA_ORIENTATION=-